MLFAHSQEELRRVQQQIAELSARLNVVLPSHSTDRAAVDERPASAPRSASAKGGKAKGRCVSTPQLMHSIRAITATSSEKEGPCAHFHALRIRVTAPCALLRTLSAPHAGVRRAEPSRA